MTKRRRVPSAPEPAPAADQPPVPPASADGRPLSPLPGAKWGAGAGVVFALLSFVSSSFLGIGDVRPADPAADIAEAFVDARGRLTLGLLLTLLSLFFLLVFVAYLHRWLREQEGDRGWLSTLALGGGLLAVGGLLVALMVPFAGTVLEDYGDDEVIARTLLVLGRQAAVITLVPLSALLGATSLVAARSGGLAKWITSSGMVLAVGLLLVPVSLIAYLFSTLWIGLVAVTLLSKARAERGGRTRR